MTTFVKINFISKYTKIEKIENVRLTGTSKDKRKKRKKDKEVVEVPYQKKQYKKKGLWLFLLWSCEK